MFNISIRKLKPNFTTFNLRYLSKFSFTQIKKITLGDLGEGTKEATIKQWYKKIGDIVKEDEEIVEVFTDKLVAPIPSNYRGKLHKINYYPDQKCQVGEVLCEIELENSEHTQKLSNENNNNESTTKETKQKNDHTVNENSHSQSNNLDHNVKKSK